LQATEASLDYLGLSTNKYYMKTIKQVKRKHLDSQNNLRAYV